MPRIQIMDFNHLTPEERIELALQLWESLSEDDIVPSKPELELVKRRRAELDEDGDLGENWKTVMDEIEKEA